MPRSGTRKNSRKTTRKITRKTKHASKKSRKSGSAKPIRIPIRKGHSLSKHNYHSYVDLDTRRNALKKAVMEYDALSVYRKLNALYIFNKNKHPSKANIFKRDRNWVKKTYMKL